LSAEGWLQNDITGLIDRIRANPAVCEFESPSETAD